LIKWRFLQCAICCPVYPPTLRRVNICESWSSMGSSSYILWSIWMYFCNLCSYFLILFYIFKETTQIVQNGLFWLTVALPCYGAPPQSKTCLSKTYIWFNSISPYQVFWQRLTWVSGLIIFHWKIQTWVFKSLPWQL
jgi:hypothetical protein